MVTHTITNLFEFVFVGMDYLNIDLEDQIDTYGVQDLVPMYTQPTPVLPSLTEDFIP